MNLTSSPVVLLCLSSSPDLICFYCKSQVVKQWRRTNSKLTMIMGQFHQHFTNIFNMRWSQKCKKDIQLKHLFALLRSAHIKAVSKHVDKIDLTTTSFFNVVKRNRNHHDKSCHFCINMYADVAILYFIKTVQ